MIYIRLYKLSKTEMKLTYRNYLLEGMQEPMTRMTRKNVGLEKWEKDWNLAGR